MGPDGNGFTDEISGRSRFRTYQSPFGSENGVHQGRLSRVGRTKNHDVHAFMNSGRIARRFLRLFELMQKAAHFFSKIVRIHFRNLLIGKIDLSFGFRQQSQNLFVPGRNPPSELSRKQFPCSFICSFGTC